MFRIKLKKDRYLHTRVCISKPGPLDCILTCAEDVQELEEEIREVTTSLAQLFEEQRPASPSGKTRVVDPDPVGSGTFSRSGYELFPDTNYFL